MYKLHKSETIGINLDPKTQYTEEPKQQWHTTRIKRDFFVDSVIEGFLRF
jgi:hypothetical protein